MASDRRRRSGQAMTEFVIAILAMILIILAMVEFLPVFLENIGLLKEVREEAGTAAIAADAGTSAADRQDEFRADIPEFLIASDNTSGHYSEKLRLPAANLAEGEYIRIPNIAGVTETLRYTNRDGTSEFLSALCSLPPDQALVRAESALSGAGWTLQEIRADDARLFTRGEAAAPSAVAAVHAQRSLEDDGQTVLTIIARTAGSTL